MLLVAFRKCDKVIDTSKSPLIEDDFDVTKWKNYKTCGFYFKGINGDILMIYICNHKSKIRFGNKEIDFLKNQPQLICEKVDNCIWVLTIVHENNKYYFRYQAYVYDSNDDDGEFDVNFGLWLLELQYNKEKLDRFIMANS